MFFKFCKLYVFLSCPVFRTKCLEVLETWGEEESKRFHCESKIRFHAFPSTRELETILSLPNFQNNLQNSVYGKSHLLFIFLFFDEEGGRQCWAYMKTLLGVVPNRTMQLKSLPPSLDKLSIFSLSWSRSISSKMHTEHSQYKLRNSTTHLFFTLHFVTLIWR